METTIAFRASAVGNEFAAVPACLVLTITDALRQKILDATTATRQFGFSEIAIDWNFGSPKVCSDELEDELANEDYAGVAGDEFDEAEDHRVDCMMVVVNDGGDLYLRCFDHYGDHRIESPCVNAVSVLAMTPRVAEVEATDGAA